MQATRPSNTAPASHGSRTLTVTSDPTQPEASSSSSNPDPAPSIEGTVRVRGTGLPGQRVQWTEETVDNEGLGRKKSKSKFRSLSLAGFRLIKRYDITVCCIYHKPKEFDESSDESSSGEDSDSSIGSADSRQARPQRSSRRRHRHHHNHDGDCEHSSGTSAGGSGSGSTRSNGRGSQTVVETPPAPIPNAYERQPGIGGGGGKGKGELFSSLPSRFTFVYSPRSSSQEKLN